MGLISPEHQWPPLPNEGADEMVWGKVFEQTRTLLMESRREYASLLRRTVPNDLVFQILDTGNEEHPFALHHGVFHPSPKKTKLFLVKPEHATLDMLNNMSGQDAERLAGMLCFEYLAAQWKDHVAPYEDDEEEEGDEDDDAPWRIEYAWEKNLSVSGYKDPEEELEVEDLTEDPEFWDFASEQTELRRLYWAILRQELSCKDVLLTDEK